ncbi:hypothetical protein CHELA17_63887 [Chelatococcus asaccharovorans]|nr:hypothetical protein CHELA17_63887 [Chelatococcus asaccharovorans]
MVVDGLAHLPVWAAPCISFSGLLRADPSHSLRVWRGAGRDLTAIHGNRGAISHQRRENSCESPHGRHRLAATE